MDPELDKVTFSFIDYCVFGSMLGISAVVGVYHAYRGRKNPDAVKEYLAGGLKMSVFPVSMSLIASWVSGTSLLGFTEEIYVFGTQILTALIPEVLVCLTSIFAFLPVFYRLEVSSSYGFLVIPIIMYVPTISLHQVTGINFNTITTVVCFVCIFYTTLVSIKSKQLKKKVAIAEVTVRNCLFQGGLKAVVWTDTIQTLVMYGGTITICIIGTYQVGGVAKVWERNNESGRIQFFNMDFDPTIRHTFWSTVIGSYFHVLSESAVSQITVQRYLAIPDIKKSSIMIMIMSIGIVCFDLITIYLGLMIYAAFYDCDPVTTQQIHKADQLLPLFVMKISKSILGLPGIFIASIFSAALSTMSTGLNCMSGLVYEDIIKPWIKKPLSPVAATRLIRLLAVIIGVTCTGLVFLVEKLRSILQTTRSLTAITRGPILGIFTLGMFFPNANSIGALTGAVTSMSIVAWISFNSQALISAGVINFPKKQVSIEGCPEDLLRNIVNTSVVNNSSSLDPFILYRISYLWYTFIGFLSTVIVGVIVSGFTGGNKCKYEDKKLYTPIVHWLLFRNNPSKPNDRELDTMKNIDA
ncbi:Similar to Slc5a6: Sodium-dependent multivitamin transporter (Rattus norvegicus) [Cotesia congregata]|uniref:Similar to Slc5a6: Sodium-dependent multivitamin transporter (Rattus norvegicus) n=1 Tax=Cotesia congregata TaxID=51543 RepID=A0A8J2HRF3_COTCN|nr:Similar to Slc5a6: Sodium-dependent multivitamin transporter (Rattus norvegicus) [Cotesia congregata]